MSNRKIGWAFTSERPVSVQSPSLAPLSDVQTRLDFSSVKSPSTAPRRLISLAKTTPTSHTPSRGTNSRLTEYHMSKQNPDLLDPVLPSSPLPTPPRGRGSSLLTSPMHRTSPYPTNRSRSATPVSLLRQTLRASKTQAQHSSLVQLATQRSSTTRHTGLSASISPVVVRLSRGADTPPNPRLIRGNPSNTNLDAPKDPCDKDTVLTALRNKRKRWTASSGVDTSSSVTAVSDQPSAKRSKHSADCPPSTGLKRPHEQGSSEDQTQGDSKRSKIVRPVPKKPTNKFSMPDIEYESEHGDVTTVSSSHTSPTDSTVSAVSNKKNTTLPVLPPNEEIVKKREESLSLLRTVFPPAEGARSRRREVPVLCATGLKPHMPAPLSSEATPTREDVLMDRKATEERLQQFFKASEDPPPTTTVPSTSSQSVESTTTSVASSGVTVESGKDGLKCSTASVVKTVSFANPVSSGLPSTTSTTPGVTASPLTGLTLTSTASLSGSLPVPATATPTLPPTTTPSQAPLKLGGELAALKQSILPVPPTGPPTGTTNLGTLVTPSSGASLANTGTGLNTANTGTGLNTANTGSGLKLNVNTNAGLKLNTTSDSGLKLNTTSDSGLKLNATGAVLGISPSLGFTTKPRAPSPLQVSHKPSLTTTTSGANPLSLALSTLTGQQSTTTGLSLSNTGPSLTSAGLSLSNTGPFLTNAGLSLSNTGPSLTNAGLNIASQKPAGLLFGAPGAASTTQQSSGGLLFGNNPTIATSIAATQQSTGGLLFGNNAATANTSTGPQPTNVGLLFGKANASKPSGLMFGSTSTTPSTGFSFSSSQSTTGGSMFGTQASLVSSAGPLLTGNAPPQNNAFSFTGKGGSQQQQLSGSQSFSLNFGNQAGNTLGTAGAGSSANTGQTNSMFGAQNISQPLQTGNSNSFSFSVGGNAQKPTGTGQFNFGQNLQQSLGAGSSQSGSGNAFSFKVAGLNAGQSNPSSLSFKPTNPGQGSGLNFQAPNLNPPQSVFKSPQPNTFNSPQPIAFNSPQPSTPQPGGFNFSASANTPSNPFNFSAGTGPANPSTPSDSASRPIARGKRRGRKR